MVTPAPSIIHSRSGNQSRTNTRGSKVTRELDEVLVSMIQREGGNRQACTAWCGSLVMLHYYKRRISIITLFLRCSKHKCAVQPLVHYVITTEMCKSGRKIEVSLTYFQSLIRWKTPAQCYIAWVSEGNMQKPFRVKLSLLKWIKSDSPAGGTTSSLCSWSYKGDKLI